MRSICFILDAYPTKAKVANQFVENLVNAIADQGIKCFVISPQSVTKTLFRKSVLSRLHEQRGTKKGNIVEVFFPKYLSFSSKKIRGFNTAVIGQKMHYVACKRILRRIIKKERIDALYAHFIFPPAITASRLSKEFNIPYFFAYGENTTYTIDYMGANKTRKSLEGVSGVVAVSEKNKLVLLEKEIVPEDKIIVLPNAINPDVFYKKNKDAMRRRLGISPETFLVTFVGRFIDVKGPDRLSAALRKLDDAEISAAFIGTGALKPDYDRIIFEGQLTPDYISNYLSASDVFVLPTLAEGCCNAIIEAMACGLPVISSDMDFNQGILDRTNSILVNPLSIEDIADAISYIKNNPQKQKQMSNASIKKASSMTIQERAKKIVHFMEEYIGRKVCK